MPHYRLFFLPAGVFLNATAIFFKFNLPDLYRNLGLLEFALTYLFQALSLRLRFGFLSTRAPPAKPIPSSKTSTLFPHSGQYLGINLPASLPLQLSSVH
jgi:hypothetical protein